MLRSEIAVTILPVLHLVPSPHRGRGPGVRGLSVWQPSPHPHRVPPTKHRGYPGERVEMNVVVLAKCGT